MRVWGSQVRGLAYLETLISNLHAERIQGLGSGLRG